jgi:hypothetical protein
MERPDLIIGYEGEGEPISAACSLCGEWMPEDHPLSLSANEVIAIFKKHFDAHVREKHRAQTAQ